MEDGKRNEDQTGANPTDPLSLFAEIDLSADISHENTNEPVAKETGVPRSIGFSGQEGTPKLESLRTMSSNRQNNNLDDPPIFVEDSSSEFGSELAAVSGAPTAIPVADPVEAAPPPPAPWGDQGLQAPTQETQAWSASPPAAFARKEISPTPSAHKWDELVSPTEFPRLTGEQILMHLSCIYMQVYNAPVQRARLLMTTYQVVFLPEKYITDQPQTFYRIPLAAIDRIEKEKVRENSSYHIVIYSKDIRYMRFTLERKADQAFSALLTYAFPGDLKLLFAVTHQLFPQGKDPGWDIYDAELEFQRQGVYSPRPDGTPSPWRVTHINRDYSLCTSYPRVLVVPAEFPEASLRSVGLFRCEGRIPVLSWGRPYDSASIWRSSQPKVGVSGNSSPPDEMLLDLIAGASTGDGILRIQDCRPKANAMVNRASGFGFESSNNYSTSRLTFLNIGNIHVMRDSLNKIHQLALSTSVQEHSWGSKIEDTGWLTHVRMVLSASWKVACYVHRSASPVLIHCSHGWDRTSQVSALAQIFLDPYFRTCDGFEVLICKDWLGFGHPFQLRSGHGMAKSQRIDDQMAPIFLQFLDTVWQLVSQFPTWFEFNSRYLLCIADHIYSCRFGTFLCDNEKERYDRNLRHNTASLWTYLRLNRKTFINPLYIPKTRHGEEENHLRTPEHDRQAVFLPRLECILRGVRLWSDYFLRYSPKPSFPDLPLKELEKHIYGPSIYPYQHRLAEVGYNTETPLEGPDGVNLVDANIGHIYCSSDEMEAWLRRSFSRANSQQQQADYQKIEKLKQLLQDDDVDTAIAPKGNDLQAKSHSDLVETIQRLQTLITKQQQKIEQLENRSTPVGLPIKSANSSPLFDVGIRESQISSSNNDPSNLFEEYEH